MENMENPNIAMPKVKSVDVTKVESIASRITVLIPMLTDDKLSYLAGLADGLAMSEPQEGLSNERA